MDRNTLTGLVLIGLILTVFTIINKPSEEDLKKNEQIAKTKEVKVNEDKSIDSSAVYTDSTVIKTTSPIVLTDSTESVMNNVIVDSSFTRETDKFRIDFSTKGGQIQALSLIHI